MNKQNKYAVIGLKALKRASKKVAENAIKNNYKIPIWKNGKIIYEIPSATAEEMDTPDTPCKNG